MRSVALAAMCSSIQQYLKLPDTLHEASNSSRHVHNPTDIPEGLKAAQQQHGATGGQTRLDVISTDAPLSHLSPGTGQMAGSNVNSQGQQPGLPRSLAIPSAPKTRKVQNI